MRILRVEEEKIVFTNGDTITFSHEQDCCDCNYADFSILNPNVINYDFDFSYPLEFESIEELGFKFGSDGRWIFIPCYSEQNGYYTSEIDIYYTHNEITYKVLSFDSQLIVD